MDRALISQELAVLRSADSVELGPVGVGAVRTRGYEAFSTLRAHRAELAQSRAELHELLNAPSPAARLYAALLLKELDASEGERALEALAPSEEPLTVWPGGCSPLPTKTLGEAAKDLAKARPEPPRNRLAEALVAGLWLAFPIVLVALLVVRSCQ